MSFQISCRLVDGVETKCEVSNAAIRHCSRRGYVDLPIKGGTEMGNEEMRKRTENEETKKI